MAHGSSKEKLETVESQLSDARQEQDPTCKNRWQGHVAVRVVALEACGSVWGV
jgi:hypothetical protein